MSNYLEFMEANYRDCEKINIMSFPNGRVQNRILPVGKLKSVTGEPLVDTYMSMNPLEVKNRSIWRDKEHVGRLKWLYVDLDFYHGYYKGFTSQQILGLLEMDYYEKKIPIPTYVVDSGRGLYLLWRVDEHIKAYPRWVKMQKYLYQQLEELGADGKVVSDSARVLRQVGSINSKSGKVVSIVHHQDIKYSLTNLIREYVTEAVPSEKMITYAKNIAKVLELELPDMNNWDGVRNFIRDNKEPANLFYHLQRMQTQERKKKCKITYLGTEYSLLLARLKDLETLLIKYRDKEGGCREFILFLYRYWKLCISDDKDKSLDAVLELNGRLKNPLDDMEVREATSSAEKYYDKGKVLRCSNAYVIEALDITSIEMEELSIFINPQERKRRKRMRNKNAYLETLKKLGKVTAEEKIKRRRKKVYKLLKKGYEPLQICKELNISRATFYADKQEIERYFAVQKEKEKLRRDKYEEYCQMLEKRCLNFSAFVLTKSFRTCAVVNAPVACNALLYRFWRSWGHLEMFLLFRQFRYLSLSPSFVSLIDI